MAIVGIAMVAVSGYYLYAYMRSGSDADLFNVDAAAPEDQLALLGQAMPKPSSFDNPDPVIDAPKPAAEDAHDEVVELEDVVSRRPVAIGRAETVSITSVMPGADLTEPEEVLEPSSLRASDIVGEPVTGDVPTTKLVPGIDDISAGSSEVPEASAISSKELIETFASIYPGGNMNPRYWSDPYWAGNLPFGGQTIPEGFVPIDSEASVHGSTNGERGLRMRIPAIELDATVSELEILDLGDSREWSTPDKVVGHIPSTADPGEMANGWYFGHLEDFLANEGDVFRRLPEISQMIKNDPVDIFISTADAEYMYRVTQTRQIYRDDLRLTDSSNAQITLVTCWPFRVYDHRIVVSAVLIAIKPLQDA